MDPKKRTLGWVPPAAFCGMPSSMTPEGQPLTQASDNVADIARHGIAWSGRELR
jgi:hypothetical protein